MLNAGTEDELGTRLAEFLLNDVDEVIKVCCRWEDYLHHFGKVARHTVALDHVGNLLDVWIELLLLPRLQLNLDEGLYVEFELFQVDSAVVAGNNALLFEFVDPGGDGR